MIQSIRNKALRNFWTKGQAKGLNANWVPRLSRILLALNVASPPEDMNLPGFYFHALTGKDAGHYSMRLTGNYRVTFGWDEQDAIDVDLEGYH